MRQFERRLVLVRQSLSRNEDHAFVEEIIGTARGAFERIIPAIPYIGGRDNLFTTVLITNAWIIALYQAMRSRERSIDEIVRLSCDTADRYLREKPALLLHAFGHLAFTSFVTGPLKKQGVQSQQRFYPQDFVFELIKGDGKRFDWKLEFSECAVIKFFESQGAGELKPFCNMVEVTYSRFLNLGLDATHTIGGGCNACVLAFRKGRPTKIPQGLEAMLPPWKG